VELNDERYDDIDHDDDDENENDALISLKGEPSYTST